MTTLVKVIAHDWPVAVMTKDEYPGREAVFTPDRVEPHGERSFYLTSMRSIKFEELQKPEKPATPETGATQYAWLIEAGGNRSAPIYWDGGDWSADHLRAVRFRDRGLQPPADDCRKSWHGHSSAPPWA